MDSSFCDSQNPDRTPPRALSVRFVTSQIDQTSVE